jgi:hypothetical protein
MIPAAVLLFAISQHPTVRAEQLVERLGGPRYVNREQVGQDLVKLGRYALPVLRRSQSHRDLEIAERCKRLVPLAEVEAIRQRVAFVLDTPPRPIPADVPLARRLVAVTGDTRAARELYVEMYVAHPKLLEEIERAGPKAADAFWSWVSRDPPTSEEPDPLCAMGRPFRPAPQPRGALTRADLALFLLLSADADLRQPKDRTVRDADTYFFDRKAAGEYLSGPKAAPVQKLLLAWLTAQRSFRDPGTEAACFKAGFRLAADQSVPGVRETALRIAVDPAAWTLGRATALLALIRVGRPEDVTQLARLLHDKSQAGWESLSDTTGMIVRLDDLALAACLTLSGRRPSDYGFPDSGRGHSEPPDVFHFGFRDDKARSAAQKKWADLADKSTTTHGRNR